MKFLISLLTAAAVTLAATPVARQATPSASVRAAIQLVIDDAGALQTAVEGLTSAGQIAAVQAAITKLENDINDGADLFTTLPALSDEDALGLASLVTPLQTSTSNAVDAVIAKKQVIVTLCVGPVAYMSFQDLIADASTFATNLQALVSAAFKTVIANASTNIQASLNRGLTAFTDAQTLPPSCITTTIPTTSTTTLVTSTTTPPTPTSTTTPLGTTSSTTSVTNPPTCPTPTTSKYPTTSSKPTTTSSKYPTTITKYPTPSYPASDCYYRYHPRQM